MSLSGSAQRDTVLAPRGAPRLGPCVIPACCWVIGLLLGRAYSALDAYLALVAATTAVAALTAARRRPIATRHWLHLALIPLAASWWVVRVDRIATHDIAHYIQAEPQLAQVTGTVDGPPHLTNPKRGAFGRFSYRSPGTLVLLRTDSITLPGRTHPATGGLLVKINQAEHRINAGDRIRVTGWLRAADPPSNPGEFDYKQWLSRQGVRGRITLATRRNWQPLPGASVWGPIQGARQHASDAAARLLRLGLTLPPERLAFLDAVLLGRRHQDLAGLDESFRRVGLAHLLAISGAHLTIMLGIVMFIARLTVANPARVAVIVLAALAVFLFIIPARVPIVRSGIMAALLWIGFAAGRATGALNLTALAALVVLIWRPGDLATPGFQLSFAVVAGLLLFTGRVSRWIWPIPLEPPRRHLLAAVARSVVDYLAVSIVASLIALPLVAYHFQFVSPFATVWSWLAVPLIIVLLAVGYLKILVATILPSVGVLLGVPMQWLTSATTGLVERAADLPLIAFDLPTKPSIFWVVTVLAVGVALLSGLFARRTPALVAAIAVCVVQPLVGPLQQTAWWPVARTDPALRLNMFAVGDGACYLVRLSDSASAGRPYVLMFDCGSQAYLDVGQQTIVPALRHLGVDHIDTLFLSHADLDHFSGALDMIEKIPVSRVLVPPQMLARARDDPGIAAAYLVQSMRDRGVPVPVATAARGWQESHNGASLQIHWPPADYDTDRSNDTSLVLSIDTSAGRVLLNGDIQRDAIESLLALAAHDPGSLRADITDLPHHGSFVKPSPAWLRAVTPTIALQSSGPARLREDSWADLIDAMNITRLVTARSGMAEVTLTDNGPPRWHTFIEPENR